MDAVQTNHRNQRKNLKPGDTPKAELALLDEEKFEAIYKCCNPHGLWKAL